MVDPAVKTGMALCVLLAGVCVAMLFRNDKAPPTEAAAPSDSEVLLRYRGTAPGPVAQATTVRAATPARTPSSMRPPTVVTPLDWHEPPPALAANYPAPERTANSGWGVSMEMMMPPATHTIVDGDTLPALAQRYLGSAARADEIFQLNRDVLSNPNLLPIGLELKLPPRDASKPTTASVGATSATPVPVQ